MQHASRINRVCRLAAFDLQTAGAFIIVAGAVVEMDPVTGMDRLGGVADANAIFEDRCVLGNVSECHLVAIGDGLGQTDCRRLTGTDHLYSGVGCAVFEHNGGIVSRVDLKTGKHRRPCFFLNAEPL